MLCMTYLSHFQISLSPSLSSYTRYWWSRKEYLYQTNAYHPWKGIHRERQGGVCWLVYRNIVLAAQILAEAMVTLKIQYQIEENRVRESVSDLPLKLGITHFIIALNKWIYDHCLTWILVFPLWRGIQLVWLATPFARGGKVWCRTVNVFVLLNAIATISGEEKK